MMLATQNPDRKAYTLTDNEVIAQCLGFLLAGHHTTSATLAMACYNLAIHPEVQDKIQKEIDTVCLENAADYQSLHKMVYLDAVISETLRLYSPGMTKQYIFILFTIMSETCTIFIRFHFDVLRYFLEMTFEMILNTSLQFLFEIIPFSFSLISFRQLKHRLVIFINLDLNCSD